MRYINFILSKSYDAFLKKLKTNQVQGLLKRLYDHYNDFPTRNYIGNIKGDINMMGEDDMLKSQWEKYLEEKVSIEKNNMRCYNISDLATFILE